MARWCIKCLFWPAWRTVDCAICADKLFVCVLICALPIGFGFIVPALVLVSHISDSAIDALHLSYAKLIWHSLMLALLAACMVMAVGSALIAFSRLGQGQRRNPIWYFGFLDMPFRVPFWQLACCLLRHAG